MTDSRSQTLKAYGRQNQVSTLAGGCDPLRFLGPQVSETLVDPPFNKSFNSTILEGSSQGTIKYFEANPAGGRGGDGGTAVAETE